MRVVVTDDKMLKGPRNREHMTAEDIAMLHGDGTDDPVTGQAGKVLSSDEVIAYVKSQIQADTEEIEVRATLPECISEEMGAPAGTPAPQLSSPAHLERASAAATEAFDALWEKYEGKVTAELAVLVRRWRVNEGCTWRRVAELAHAAIPGADWKPPSNQLAGMVICDSAAHFFGEHYMDAPWN